MHTSENPSRSKRCRERRKRVAALKAAGLYVPKHRSHFLTVDIRDAVQSDVRAMRQQMEAQRDRLRDRSWAFREAAAESPAPLSVIAVGVPRA